jgi:hypothetical protein
VSEGRITIDTLGVLHQDTPMTQTLMKFDPTQTARIEADAALLKRLLNETATKLTYMQFGEMIGIGTATQWGKDENEMLSMICQSIYTREYHCYGISDPKSWAVITWKSGSPWTWGRREHWDWSRRVPPDAARARRA